MIAAGLNARGRLLRIGFVNELLKKCSQDRGAFKASFASSPGFIFPFIKWLFDRILWGWLSLNYWLIAYRFDKKETRAINGGHMRRYCHLRKRRYYCVDGYVVSWFALGIIFFLALLLSDGLDQQPILRFVFAIILCYRLFDIFQAWVNMFLLEHDPQLRDPNRNLVLAFIGYLEIVIAYSVLAFLFKNGFKNVSTALTFGDIVESLRYSLGILTTLGSNWEPSAFNGYSILCTQLTFGLLFVVIVIQRIITLVQRRAPR